MGATSDTTSMWAHARLLFPAAEAYTYLDHAAVGPTSTRVRAAILASADAQTNIGLPAAAASRAEFARVRATLARLVGGVASGVALLHNTSTALSIAANGIEWQPGENVVVVADGFPSNFYPWKILERHGVEVRLTERDGTGSVVDSSIAAIDAKTRAVAISAVHYSNGVRQRTAELAAECHRQGALLVVDGTQAVGAVDLDVLEEGIDVLAAGGYKWMLGPLGTAFAHFSDRALESLTVSTAGWMSVDDFFDFSPAKAWDPTARRFEAGTENAIGIFGFGAAVDLLLELSTARIEDRLSGLIEHTLREADRKNLQVVSSRDPTTRSGIVVLANPCEDADDSRGRLMDAGILCSSRGGGVRLSPHFYTRESELTWAVEVLSGARAGRSFS